MDSIDVDDNLELNADEVELSEVSTESSSTVSTIEEDREDVVVPNLEDEIEIKEEEVKLTWPGGWFYFSKPGVSPLYRNVQTFSGMKPSYVPWVVPRQWGAQSVLTNEISEDSVHNKHRPLYPFYAFRKISH